MESRFEDICCQRFERYLKIYLERTDWLKVKFKNVLDRQ